MVKDEEVRMLLRKRGYRILELSHNRCSGKIRDQLFLEILDQLGKQ